MQSVTQSVTQSVMASTIQNVDNVTIGDVIQTTLEEIHETEVYYDSLGMALSMAVLKNNIIVLSSKHWMKNCYIEVQVPETENNNDKFVYGLWDVLVKISRTINREFDRASNEDKYVYISNLNRAQTAQVYESIIKELEDRNLEFDVVEQYNIFGWNVTHENCVKIPWIAGFKW